MKQRRTLIIIGLLSFFSGVDLSFAQSNQQVNEQIDLQKKDVIIHQKEYNLQKESTEREYSVQCNGWISQLAEKQKELSIYGERATEEDPTVNEIKAQIIILQDKIHNQCGP